MKQKLALACTLVHEPEVILLDEPTTGVDPVSRREFWKLLSQFLAEGITILMSTPYLDEAERCSRVAFLYEGRLLALDEPGRLRSLVEGTLVELLLADPRGAVQALAGTPLSNAQVFGDRVHIWLDEADRDEALRIVQEGLARAGVTPAGLRIITPSLEDVFIAKLARASAAGATGQPS
jgi:ABC-2 type transport system ATP-binding protein